MGNYEDKIYFLGDNEPGQTQTMSQAVQKTLENNGGVGIMTGSYDQNLSILSVDNLLLHSTGYTFDTFMEQTKGSLRNFFYDEEDAKKACEAAGVAPLILPIRGGTDGCQLSFKGLPCPNLGTGGHAFHGPYEHISVEGMEKSVELLLALIQEYTK